MDEEEKKGYLKELSENYIKEINNAKSMPKKKKKIFKVKFDLKRNETHCKDFLLAYYNRF
jgi:N-acetylneuraminic acid mutarotase